MQFPAVLNMFIEKTKLNSILTNDLRRKEKFSKNVHSYRPGLFKSRNLMCWNSILEYLVFSLFVLDYFGLFSFGFRLSVHLELTSKSGDQKLLKDLC